LLSDAVAAFLDSVSERGFDQPLLAILRAQGFECLHFVHGPREFGKDAIGRRDSEQWGWQSKAGDITQSAWRELTGQLDELRLANLGHGAFDISLPRRAVLVTTGRLTGNAPDLLRDYNQRASEKGEIELELWDRETLIGVLAGNPDAVLRGSTDGQLLAALGSADEGTATLESLELFSRRWSTWEPERLAGLGVIEATVLCGRLAFAERLDLACHLALCLVRGAHACGGGAERAEAAARLFELYAEQLFELGVAQMLEEDFVAGGGASAWVTYPVRCVRIAEIIGLLSLRLRETDPERAAELAQWLARFLAAQPGTAHPISDNYAVSLIPAALAVAGTDSGAAEDLLRRSTVWLCDAYERERIGLAALGSSPAQEIERLIGAPLEWVELRRRADSGIAAVVLDLAAALGFADLYADIYNDIEAVGIHPRVLRVVEGPDLFDRTGLGNRLDPHVDFAESLEGEPPTAPHHRDAAGRELCESGRAWDLLAVTSALRDRHFYCALLATSRPLEEVG
jgi:hypothetical protein